jgi:cysteinyl-tRNA synthetase
MSQALLGTEFDIHGGGADLTFPHHENEIAQSCCAHPGSRFAGLWMHNGMVKVDGRKMSKSLGNFFTVQDKLSQGVPGEVIRLALLSSHYRGALDWTAQVEEGAAKTLARWAKVAGDATPGAVPRGVLDALADDLNTPGAIAEMHRLATVEDAPGLAAAMALLNLRAPAAAVAGDVAARIEALLLARAEARKAKDFAKADAIRKALDAAGVVVMDRTGGPTEWELGPAFDAAALDAAP